MKLRSKKGFSLVELIIVIAILGIIAVIAVPNLTGIQQRSQVNADIRTAEQIGKAVRIWRTENAGRTFSASEKNITTAWQNYKDLTDINLYISTDHVPVSYTNASGVKEVGAYWVKIGSTAAASESIWVAIGDDTTVPTATTDYTDGKEGIAYKE